MKKYYLLLCLMYSCIVALHGELPVEVSFFDLPKLEQHHEKEIRIRGFLYETINNELILSSRPKLKSCCLDKFPKIYVHNFQGNLDKKVVTVEGKLFVSKDNVGLKYELQNARMAIENKSQTSILLIIVVLGSAIALIFYIFNRSTKERTAKA